MGRLLIAASCGAAALLLALRWPARMSSIWALICARVSTDATQSRLTGGLGKLRFDGDQDGVRLGYVRMGYRADPTETVRVIVRSRRLR